MSVQKSLTLLATRIVRWKSKKARDDTFAAFQASDVAKQCMIKNPFCVDGLCKTSDPSSTLNSYVSLA